MLAKIGTDAADSGPPEDLNPGPATHPIQINEIGSSNLDRVRARTRNLGVSGSFRTRNLEVRLPGPPAGSWLRADARSGSTMGNSALLIISPDNVVSLQKRM